MNFLNKLTALSPFGKGEENLEYFFAVNIGVEKLSAALWVIKGRELKVLDIASQNYSSHDEIASVTDKLLDQVLGLKEVEPQKILFGVPNSWLIDDNLKDEYLKILRHLVKELELSPMAYVATSNALIHFLEQQEGVPTTAILVGIEERHLTVTVVRAGKLDGVKILVRSSSCGADIEKTLLAFTDVETLPSKILIYGSEAEGLKSQLVSFSWMSKLSFLHFPKIDVLGENIEIKSVCLAGGSELNDNIIFTDQPVKKQSEKVNVLEEESPESSDRSEDLKVSESEDQKEESDSADLPPADTPIHQSAETPIPAEKEDFGFIVGDVAEKTKPEAGHVGDSEERMDESFVEERSGEAEEEQELVVPEENFPIDDYKQDFEPQASPPKKEHKKKFSFKNFIPRSFTSLVMLFGIIGIIVLAVGAYVFFLKADVKIFVEPKVLEKDAQIVADPKQKTVNEDGKIIPGQIIETDISGSAKDSATGKRQIGDPSKGTVVIYNKTSDSQTLSKGTQISGTGGTKFTLDTSVSIASQSASDSGITFGKANTTVTATTIGADGNLPSGSDFAVAGYANDKVAAKSEGNFSGGTSKDVTVVSSEDQQKLLAKLSSDLRQQAQQKLQEKFPKVKILAEALSESISKKTYNKNINDQASEFSLNLTIKYKGTAYDDADLKTIVSKLVTTQVPDGFELNLSDTETQADVSKLEKDGRLVFLAKFKAKLMPKIDTTKIINQIKLKRPTEAIEIIKGLDNVLGAEIKMTPDLPAALQLLPILSKNIKVEVGLK